MKMNKVILCGRLGQDPVLRTTPSGQSVCNLNLATSKSWVDKGGAKQQSTEWHKIIVWGKTGENCSKYLAKGREILVEGELQTRSWEDKDGSKRYATEIVAHNVQFIGNNPPSQQGGAQPQTQSPKQNHAQTQPQDQGGWGGFMGEAQTSHLTPGLDDIPF
jgi:single-strand DNA-binding protein